MMNKKMQAVEVFKLYQDGDLWLVCYELVSNEEKINFGFDVEEMEE